MPIVSRIVLLTGVLAGACAAQKPFTLEQALSAPFPTGLAASPTGAKVAWVFNARGVRNIWIAEPPRYQGRAITSFSQDDGQEILDLHWSADASAIVYVRGESPNTRGEIPNPTSDPRGAEQAVWVAPVDGGAPRTIGEGSLPAVCPRGDVVAFVRGGQIWTAPLKSTEKAVQLAHTRGTATALSWSPDGYQLAFVSARGDHGFIGVYSRAAQALRYLDPSVDQDSEPSWSPDGKRIAFIRVPARGRNLVFGPRRAGDPWSIRVADVATGQGREIWKAEPGPGSVFHPVVAERQIFWMAGDRLIFPWERDGWTHLYAIPATGGPATLLTPGAFEVEHVAAGPGAEELVLSSNQSDIDRRHVWKLGVRGPAPVALTSGAGMEWSPVPLSDSKTIAFLRSGAQTPASPAVLSGAGPAQDLASGAIPADFPRPSLVIPQPVIFSAADGMEIHAQLFLPPRRTGERAPAVIFFHGGSRRQMLLGFHYMYYYHNAYAFNQYLASRGYVVLSVNYRSGIGYGLNFREAINYGASGGSEFEDVQGAGLYLRSRADVDPRRIALWGGSYGGYLTALGLARASDLFAAGVDLHGVHDWSTLRGGSMPPERARVAHDASPLAWVKDWRSPVLLIHGDDDRNVNFSQTVDLVEALRRQKVDFEQLIFPDEIHDFLLHAHWLQAYRAAEDFLSRKLVAGAR